MSTTTDTTTLYNVYLVSTGVFSTRHRVDRQLPECDAILYAESATRQPRERVLAYIGTPQAHAAIPTGTIRIPANSMYDGAEAVDLEPVAPTTIHLRRFNGVPGVEDWALIEDGLDREDPSSTGTLTQIRDDLAEKIATGCYVLGVDESTAV